MANAGNTLDETIGLIVAANNVIQDPEAVGTMWKTVSMRIRGARTELEEAGLDTELMATSTSTLRDKIMAITNIHGGGGFDILTDTGAFKSTYDIILGISKVWDELGKTDPVGQAALLELLAGKRQGNALAAALTNMKDGVAATEAAYGSAGSAAKEYDKWQNSIQAHLQSLGASWEAFSIKALDSNAVLATVDALKLLSQGLTSVVGTFGAVPTIATIFGAVQGASGKGLIQAGMKDSGKFGLFFKKSQLDQDVAALNKYNSALKEGMQSELALEYVRKGGSDLAAGYAQNLKGQIADTEAYAKANQDLGKSFSAASLGAKALNMVLDAALMFAVTEAINLIVQGIDALVVTTEEHREKLSNLKSDYGTITSDLDKVNSQLTETQSKMTAIEATGISLVDDAEYQKLVDTNTELEKNKRLLEAQKVVNQTQTQKEFVATMESQYGSASSGYNSNTVERTLFAAKFYSPENAKSKRQVIEQNIKDLNDLSLKTSNAYDNLITATEGGDPKTISKAQKQYDAAKGKFDKLSASIQKEVDLLTTDAEGVTRVENPKSSLDKAINDGLDFIDWLKNATTDAILAASGYDVSEEINKTTSAIETSKTSVESLTSAHSALSSALEQQNQDGYLSIDSYKALIEANSGYADSLEMVNGKLQINIDKAYDVTRASVAEQVSALQAQKVMSELALDYESANGASDDRVEALKQEIIQYDLLIESLIDSRSALNAYKAAAASANTGSNYDYAASDMRKTFEEGTSSLRTQTDEFQKAAEYFTGQQSVTAEQASAWLEKNGTWIDGTVDGLNAFIDASIKAGVIIEKNGQYTVAAGMDAEQWANKLGTSAELVKDALGKLNEFEGNNYQFSLTEPPKDSIMSESGINDYLSKLDRANAAMKMMKITEEEAAQAGLSASDIQAEGLKNWMDALSDIDPSNLKEMIAQFTVLNDQSGGAYENELAGLKDLLKQYEDFDTKSLGEAITVSVTDVTGKSYPLTFDAGTSLSSVQKQIEAIAAQSYQLKFTLGNIGGFFSALFGGGSASGTANAGGSSAANGRYKTRSGKTLTGELGQELVVDMNTGRWYTVGDYGAEFVSLPENAIVFNHVQTQSILKNGRINNRGQAMAGGNAAPAEPPRWRISGGGNPLKGTQPKKKYDSPKTASIPASYYDDEIKAIEHQIKIISDMINLYAEGSQSWFEQQSNMIETYKRAAQLAQTEYDRLKASGKDVNSEEMRDLLETLVKYKTEIFKESEAYWEAEKENAKTTLSYYKDQTQAVIDLKTSYHNLVKEVQSEQISIDKELQTAASAYPFLTAAEQAAVFDDADYRALSDELSNISNQANAMYLQYLDQIKSVGEDDAYLLDSITDEFKRQYDLQMDSYNVAKARLGVIKAEKNLENVKGERSVAALIGGVWTWIADSENVKSALEELSQAEQDLASAQSDAQFNSDVANLESTVTAIDQQIDAIDNLVYSMDDLATEVHSLVDTMQSNITAAMSASTLASFDALKNYTGTSTSLFNTSTLQDLIAQNLLGSSSLYTTNISSGIDISTILKNLKDIILPITTGSSSLGDFVNVGQITITGDVASQFIALLRSVAPLG